ncbi:MAG: NADP-dependent oxidoreductase [Leptospiraceae bacterium]|nr:NADP-dependent oxidoreductase [Leptospiraceae bacterium]MCP5502154.1 NADP-dependent oxidoreductase [Leptospiraceae bacterium]
MRAIILEQFGDINVLQEKEMEKPVPKEGEVLVNIHAAGINPVDWKIRKGLLQSRVPHIFPIIPGWDMAGTVVDRGHAARRFEIGEAVFAYARRPVIQEGCYAEFISLPEAYLAKKPERMSFEEAASIPLACLTAYQSLFSACKLKESESLLVIGASGGVGSFAIQLAKYKGAKVIAVCSKKNHSYVKQLGADICIDYIEEDFLEGFKRECPNGVDVIFDCVGGETQLKSFSCVRPKTRYVSILAFQKPIEDLNKGDSKYHYVFVEPNAKQLEEIANIIDEGALKTEVSARFNFSEVDKAHRQAETLHTRGKIILVNT